MFTEASKYMVKLGFRIESSYQNSGQRMDTFVPTTKPLLAFPWKLKCSPKLRHFVWKILSDMLPEAKNHRTRRIDCDLKCSICGADEDSTNHVLFECSPALQTWVLKESFPPGHLPILFSLYQHGLSFLKNSKDDDFIYFP